MALAFSLEASGAFDGRFRPDTLREKTGASAPDFAADFRANPTIGDF
jgi:hypothetical protein